MGPLQPSLVDALGAVRSLPPRIAVYSTVTGGRADDTVFDAGYFARNMHQPVRFAPAIGAMNAAGCNLFLELSPHPVLGQSIVECVAPLGREPVVLASLRRGRAERETMLQACAGLYEAGRDLDWKQVQPSGGSVVTLPGYCWQRTRHWIRARPDNTGEPMAAGAWHPFVGRQIAVAGIEAQVFEGGSHQASAWLADHRVFGRLLLPGAAMMEMLTAAVGKAMHWPRTQLMDFALQRPSLLPEQDEGHARWQVVVKPLAADRVEVALYAATSSGGGAATEWLQVAGAIGRPDANDPAEDWSIGYCAIEDGHPSVVDTVPVGTIYDRFQEHGVAFGPAFRCLGDVRLGDGAAQAWIELPPTLHSGNDFPGVHPVLIDAALQLCWLAAACAGPDAGAAGLFLPIGADRVTLRSGRHDRLRVRVCLCEPATGSTFAANVLIETAAGEQVVIIDHMRFASADRSTVAWASKHDDLYTLNWIPAPSLPSGQPVSPRGAWIVFADNGGTADAIAAEIDLAGGNCHLVHAGTACAQVAQRRWVIDPANPDHYHWLLEELGRAGTTFRGGVIHCWSLDMACGDQTEPGRLAQDDLIGTGSLLHLLQCLTSHPSSGTCPTYVLTRGAQDVTGTETVTALQPRAAGLCGLAGVAALEHPELGLRVIDLDPSEDTANGRRLLSELLDQRDARVALRGLERWLPRLQRHALTAPRSAAMGGDRAVRLALVRPGSFDGLELTKFDHAVLQSHEVRLRVLSAGINFRDVLTVLQMYPGPPRRSGLNARASSPRSAAPSRRFASATACSGSRRQALVRRRLCRLPSWHAYPIRCVQRMPPASPWPS